MRAALRHAAQEKDSTVMLYTRSLMLSGLLLLAAGCGARTISDDYRDDAGDVPVAPDVPVTPDTPVTPDLPVTCPAPTVRCGPGPCVDPRNDTANCGACGLACLRTQICVSGACISGCDPPRTFCGTACTDLRFDNNNCGACGVSCGPSGTCSNGVCSGVACPGGLTFCGGRCVDTRNDPTNCGACGLTCPGGVACINAACAPFCPRGQALCGGRCVDVLNDPSNCGACGRACVAGTTCQGGTCAPVCPPPTTRCGAACADLSSDAMNCGACGHPCPPGLSCTMGVCRGMTMTGTPFQIDQLTADHCLTAEHNMYTGDDRGGIAVGSGAVFYTGDSRTASFNLDTLAPNPGAMLRLDGIFSMTALDLAVTLGSNRAPLDERTSIIDTMMPVSPGVTLGPPTALTRTAFIDRTMTFGAFGVFSGPSRVIVTAGSRAWIIDGPMGLTTELAIAPLGAHQTCESWAFWGVAEFIDGAPWVAYVRDARTVVRQNLVSGAVRTVASFENLADMCSIAAAPARNRWYFHHEGTSQFRSGDETLGYCDARYLTR